MYYILVRRAANLHNSELFLKNKFLGDGQLHLDYDQSYSTFYLKVNIILPPKNQQKLLTFQNMSVSRKQVMWS